MDYDPNNPPKYCPQCMKRGIKKKVRAYYINLDNEVRISRVFQKYYNVLQGVKMCEEITCPWPFNLKIDNVVIKMDPLK